MTGGETTTNDMGAAAVSAENLNYNNSIMDTPTGTGKDTNRNNINDSVIVNNKMAMVDQSNISTTDNDKVNRKNAITWHRRLGYK